MFFKESAVKLSSDSLIKELYQKNKGILFQTGFLGMQEGVVELSVLTNSFSMEHFGWKYNDQDVFLAFLFLLIEEVKAEGMDAEIFKNVFYNLEDMREAKKAKKDSKTSSNLISFSTSPEEEAKKLGFGLKPVPSESEWQALKAG